MVQGSSYLCYRVPNVALPSTAFEPEISVYRMSSKWSWTIQSQKHPIYVLVLLVYYSDSNISFRVIQLRSFFFFWVYKPYWEKLIEWPQIDLETSQG